MKDQKNFLQKIEKLKPYIVEVNQNSTIKPKIYLADCTIEETNQ